MIKINKWILITLYWILSNIIWMIIVLPATFNLGISISEPTIKIGFKYYISLLTFGILQGLLISICQGSVLWLFKLPKNKIVRLSLANIIGSLLGITILSLYTNMSGINYNSLLLILIWNLSLFLVGILWGLAAGSNTFQKVDWAISTGLAYLLWGMASLIVALFSTTSTVGDRSSDLYISLILAAVFYGLGFCLNMPKVISLLSKYQKS